MTYSKFYSATLGIHSDLELHVLNKGLQDAFPVLFERSVSVARNRDPSVLILHSEISDLDLIEFDLSGLLGLHGLKLHEFSPLRIIQLHSLVNARKGSLGLLRQLLRAVILGLFKVLSNLCSILLGMLE